MCCTSNLKPASYISLDQLPDSTQAVARKLCGGRVFASRLGALGLSVGSHLQVLQNLGRGPILICVHNTRIALGRSEAMKILVEEISI
ncbi:FeoA family protein [Methylococcus sp. ANG]|uniref:FeoA family protein n=1 Tax=Methylococcus sp. ANG TaxID=3231903 RepID=UPI00345806FE